MYRQIKKGRPKSFWPPPFRFLVFYSYGTCLEYLMAIFIEPVRLSSEGSRPEGTVCCNILAKGVPWKPVLDTRSALDPSAA